MTDCGYSNEICELCRRTGFIMRISLPLRYSVSLTKFAWSPTPICRRCLWIFAWAFHHDAPFSIDQPIRGIIDELSLQDFIVPDAIEVKMTVPRSRYHPDIHTGSCDIIDYLIAARHLLFARLPRDMLRAVLGPLLECGGITCNVDFLRLDPVTSHSFRDCTGGQRPHTAGRIVVVNQFMCLKHAELTLQLEILRPICEDSLHSGCW